MEREITYCLTLYSFSKEYVFGQYNLEECLAKGREMGYTGVELVASQMLPGYPYPTRQWKQEFKALLKKYNMHPVCYSAYIDMGTHSDRDLNESEIIQSTLNDMLIAKELGFDLVRTQHAISPVVFEKMLDYCKKIGMKLAIEMHHPHNPEVPIWKEYLEIMDRSGGWLGIVPDFSIFAETPHILHIRQAIDEMGCREDKVKNIIRRHLAGETEESVLSGDYSNAEKNFVREVYEQYAPCKIEWLNTLIKNSFYVHGKFWYLEEGINDICIPYHKLMPRLKELGYRGYVASEYEGHHFNSNEEAAVQLRRFVTMCDRILNYTF